MPKYDIGIKEVCEYRFTIEAESEEKAIDKAFDELMSGTGEEDNSDVYSRVIAVDNIPKEDSEWKLDHY